MNTDWHLLSNMDGSATGEISADIIVGPDSLWFDGHFPGFPVLPGIAQLGMVFDLLGNFLSKDGTHTRISGVSRVRFRQLLRPGDAINVTATPERDSPGRFKFRVMAGEQLACSGIMELAPGER